MTVPTATPLARSESSAYAVPGAGGVAGSPRGASSYPNRTVGTRSRVPLPGMRPPSCALPSPPTCATPATDATCWRTSGVMRLRSKEFRELDE